MRTTPCLLAALLAATTVQAGFPLLDWLRGKPKAEEPVPARPTLRAHAVSNFNPPSLPADIDPDQPLDLEAAINRALFHNRGILNARLGIEESRQLVAQQASAFSLRITPEGRASAGSSDDQFGYGLNLSRKTSWGSELSLGGDYGSTGTNSTERARLRVQFNQPLFSNAGRLVHLEPLRQSESQLLQARRRLETRKADLILEVVRLYERLLQLKRQITIDDKSAARLTRLLELTRAREAQGKVSRVDSLRVELQQGQARSRLQNSRERHESEMQNFADLLGFPVDQAFILLTPPLLDVSLPSLADGIETALQHRLDYAQVLQDHDDSRRQLQIAERRLQPDLQLTTRYEQFDETDESTFGLGDHDWFTGVTVGSDLNKQNERAQFRQSGYRVERLELDIEDRRFAIAREVKQQIRAYRRAGTDLRINERNAEIASRRLELASELFRMGRADNVEVTDAETAWLEAENLRLAARAEASLSGYRLLRTMGILIDYPPALKPEARP